MIYRKLGDFTTLKQGLAINSGTKHLIQESRDEDFVYPLLRIADMMENKFTRFISKNVNHSVVANEDDIIYTRTGQIGLAFKGFQGVVHNNSFIISLKNDELTKDYLYVLLQSDFVKNQALKLAKNSVQPDLTHDMFKSILVPLPDKNKQNIISYIYNTLSNKIRLNNKINSELESMAKTLYDYWFLQFEFPNEEGKPYKSSGGKMVWNEELKREIPEGWEVKTIGELVEVVLGGTPKTDKAEYWNGNINWLNSGEVAQFPVVESELKITEQGLNNSATEFMKRGTTIVSITGNIRTSFLAIDSCANQSVIGLIENDLMKKSYLHPLMKDAIDYYLKISTGNCQQHINKQTIKDTKFPLPPLKVLNKYYKKCEPIYELISTNGLNSKNLASLRDFLLPMLMNGQVTFKNN